MGSFGQCAICGDKILYAPDDIGNLGQHLIQKHPGADVTHFQLSYETHLSTCGCQCINCNNPQCRESLQKNRRKAYKTTIESWKKAQNPQKCLKCGKISVPLIKRQRHKLAKSPLGAFILLGCWPICFLPFILGGSDLMYLYCKECGNFLGMYDRRVAQKDGGICKIQDVDCNPEVCGCN